MNTYYEEMKTALQVLCENRGLRLVEKCIANSKILCSMDNDRIVINLNYHKIREAAC